jgi:hypothetical protein
MLLDKVYNDEDGLKKSIQNVVRKPKPTKGCTADDSECSDFIFTSQTAT